MIEGGVLGIDTCKGIDILSFCALHERRKRDVFLGMETYLHVHSKAEGLLSLCLHLLYQTMKLSRNRKFLGKFDKMKTPLSFCRFYITLQRCRLPVYLQTAVFYHTKSNIYK